MKGMIIDKTIEGTISDRIEETKGIEIEVKVVIGTGQDLEITQGTVQEIGINTVIEARAEVEIEGKGPELLQEKERVDQGQIQDLDQVPVLALIEADLGAIDAANVIILQGNALMH